MSVEQIATAEQLTADEAAVCRGRGGSVFEAASQPSADAVAAAARGLGAGA